jgi:hypothetical protein
LRTLLDELARCGRRALAECLLAAVQRLMSRSTSAVEEPAAPTAPRQPRVHSREFDFDPREFRPSSSGESAAPRASSGRSGGVPAAKAGVAASDKAPPTDRDLVLSLLR